MVALARFGGQTAYDRCELFDTETGLTRAANDRPVGEHGVRDRFPDVLGDKLDELFVHHVALGDHDHPGGYTEQAQHVEVLAGLRHDAVIGGHDQHRQVHATGAGHHRADQALVPGHIDEGGVQIFRTAVVRVVNPSAMVMPLRRFSSSQAVQCPPR